MEPNLEKKKKDNSGWWGLLVFVIIFIVALVYSAITEEQSAVNNTNSEVISHTCNIPANCGGGTKAISPQECSNLTCCPVTGKWILYNSPAACLQAQKIEALQLAYEATGDYNEALALLEILHPEWFPSSQYSVGSGHEAGYQWAENNDIDSTFDCGGNSDSFIEGCQQYVCEMADYYPDDYGCY